MISGLLAKLDFEKSLNVLMKYDEQIFLSTIFVLTSAMFIQATIAYDFRSRIFPQFVTAPAAILAFIFLIRPYLPERIQFLFEDPGDRLRDLTESVDEDIDVDDRLNIEPSGATQAATSGFGDESATYDSALNRFRSTIPAKVATGIMALLFVMVALLIGIFWAAPVLLVGYYLWFGKKLTHAIITTIFVLAFIWVVGDILNMHHIMMDSPLPSF